MLHVDSEVIAQGGAIFRRVAHDLHLCGSTPKVASRADMIVCSLADITGAAAPYFQASDADKPGKLPAVKEKVLPMFATLEKMLTTDGGQWYGGEVTRLSECSMCRFS